jgi:hypothetical protein
MVVGITQASKKHNVSIDKINYLIKKGRIGYAENGDITVICEDDLIYHLEQVRLRKLSHNGLIKAKEKKLLQQLNFTPAQINQHFAIRVPKSKRTLK